MRNEAEYCRETGKYIYSSYAKGHRAKNRYEDIKRIYYCEHCEGYHSTSIDREEAIEIGIEVRKIEKVSKRQIAKRLKELQRRTRG